MKTLEERIEILKTVKLLPNGRPFSWLLSANGLEFLHSDNGWAFLCSDNGLEFLRKIPQEEANKILTMIGVEE